MTLQRWADINIKSKKLHEIFDFIEWPYKAGGAPKSDRK